jgi:hypothetical protein
MEQRFIVIADEAHTAQLPQARHRVRGLRANGRHIAQTQQQIHRRLAGKVGQHSL